ncbi:MAG: polysulfide reductase NrfD [Acidobacteriota bacterium]|nr:MAG: polysulfide reductase NrfD [Acidobacteriota bacterium]
MSNAPRVDPKLLSDSMSMGSVTAQICQGLDRPSSALWWGAFLAAATALGIGVAAVAYQLRVGIGTWGLNNTVGWAFDITNFVFWIGIGHAGTFISAILFLFRQRWRTSVGRSAEAVTIFAVICAALFPIIHLGRPWLTFWMFPYPNFRGPLWINFRSPLVWDVFAIATYFTISVLFWYLGLLPDFASIRERTRSRLRRKIYGLLSLGWTGSQQTWMRYETVYLLIAGLATALVISVHSIVSWDFAASIIPGWHSTVFPPYFVIGAIFSGMAMVLALTALARRMMHLEAFITVRHFDLMSKVLLFGSLVIGLTYVSEIFFALYSGDEFELFVYANRISGTTWGLYHAMIILNVGLPQLIWFRRIRASIPALFFIAVGISVGMWIERFVIVMGSLHRDYLPANWADYTPTWIELATLLGSFGLFFVLYLLFCRFLPVISISEVKQLVADIARREET